MFRAHDLHLPHSLPAPGPLQGPGDTLAHAGAARARPFALATPRVHVVGGEMEGVRSVTVDDFPLLMDLSSDAGACASVVLTPVEVRRELVGARGSILETVLPGDRVAGLIAEWRASSGGALELTLRWSAAVRGSMGGWADDDPEGWQCEGSLLGVRRRISPRAHGHVLFHLTPAPSAWTVVPEEGRLRVEARVQAPPGGHVTLLTGVGHEPEDAAATLTALRAAPAVERRMERALAELRTGGLALVSGVREVDDGVAWAAARVGGALGSSGARLGSGPPDGPPRPFPFDAGSEAAWTGLGALASGRPDVALAALPRSLENPLAALLLGRWVAWTGRVEVLGEWRNEALQAAAALDPEALDPERRTVWRAALDTWMEAAECIGNPAWAAPLQERRDALGDGTGGPARAAAAAPGGLRLPTVGSVRPGGATLLAALVGEPAPGYAPLANDPEGALERGLHAWAAYQAGRAGDGFRLLRRHLAAGFEDVPGAWRRAPGSSRFDDTAAAAVTAAAVLFGMLGARADAFYGRLRLAPHLPSHWTRLNVTGIRVGDAAVELRWAREGERHTFRLRQVAGSVPLNLVFEPEVPLSGAVDVSVDGALARVGTKPTEGGTTVRLQLPLDADREVAVAPARGRGAEAEPPGATPP